MDDVTDVSVGASVMIVLALEQASKPSRTRVLASGAMKIGPPTIGGPLKNPKLFSEPVSKTSMASCPLAPPGPEHW